jgi:hypothetical protein
LNSLDLELETMSPLAHFKSHFSGSIPKKNKLAHLKPMDEP